MREKVLCLLILTIMAFSLFGCSASTAENAMPIDENDIGFDSYTSTMNAIADLLSDLQNNSGLHDVQEKYGAVVIRQTHDTTDINLVRYDANPIGLGTLERTWTFLQIVSEDKIEVYTLYEQSAEYPLRLELFQLPNGNLLVEVSGTTNVFRGGSSFIDYWEYSVNGLKNLDRNDLPQP